MSINGKLTKLREALHSALCASAPDGGSWLAGQAVFWESIKKGSSVDDALCAALCASAPDGGSWLEGQRVFYDTLFSLKKPATPSRMGELLHNLFKDKKTA